MSVRAAVSDQTHPHTRGVVHTSNRAAVHAVNGLRVRHGHEHDAAQQYCSDEQSCAQPALARVRTPSVQHFDVLGAGRAAPGVLAVVARSIHLCCACVCEGSGLQLTVLCGLGSWGAGCVPRLVLLAQGCEDTSPYVTNQLRSRSGRTRATKKLERRSLGQDYLAA